MSAQIVPDANDSISEEYSEEPVVKGKASFVDSSIELPEKNEEPEEVETEKPTDPVQKYLPLIRAITRQGHSDIVISVSFSPDGRRIVSGSSDRTIRIWDAESGQELLKLEGHSSYVSSVSFSPDGRRIVSGGDDRTIRIWDDILGRLNENFTDHENEYLCSHPFEHIIFRYVCDFEERVAVRFQNTRFQEAFLADDFLEVFLKDCIQKEGVTSILNVVNGLGAINQLEKHIRLLGVLQTLEQPNPRNLERFASDPTVIKWMNIVLGNKFCKFMMIWDFILQILHLICFAYVAYYIQDIPGTYQDIEYSDDEELIPVLWTLLVVNCYYTIYEIRQGYAMYHLKLFVSWVNNIWNIADFGCLATSYLLFIYACFESMRVSNEFRIIGSVGVMLLWFRMLGFIKGTNAKLATFVLALFQIFEDLGAFMVVLIMLLATFLHGIFIYAHRKGIGSDIESFASIKNLALRLIGMTLGEYDVDDYSDSLLMLTYFLSYMLLMTIIMLNVLIAIVSDSYDSVMIRSRKLFLRAKFQIVADMMLMFPNTIQSKEESFKYIGSSLTDKALSFVCQPYGLYPIVKHFWLYEWRAISGEYDITYNGYEIDIDELPSWKCWWARLLLMVRIVVLLPFWILHLCSNLIGELKFSEIDMKKYRDDPNDNGDEDDWLGRALDTERRVKKIVDEMKAEMKAEISATKAEMNVIKTEVNSKLDAIMKKLNIEA